MKFLVALAVFCFLIGLGWSLPVLAFVWLLGKVKSRHTSLEELEAFMEWGIIQTILGALTIIGFGVAYAMADPLIVSQAVLGYGLVSVVSGLLVWTIVTKVN